MKITKLQPPISRMFLFMFTIVLWNCSSSADLILPANEDVSMKLKSGKITSEEYVCNPQSVPLISAQNHSLGSVNLITDMYGAILISISVKNGWNINNIQLYAGNELSGEFTQNVTLDPGEVTYSTYYSPILFYSFDGKAYSVIAIRAELTKNNKSKRITQTEEVWIAGQKASPEQSWETYYLYERIPCGTPQP